MEPTFKVRAIAAVNAQIDKNYFAMKESRGRRPTTEKFPGKLQQHIDLAPAFQELIITTPGI